MKITRIYRTDKSKDGAPLISKKGKPYTRCSIKVSDPAYEDKWLSGFGGKITDAWTEGDVLELGEDILIEENGQYLNFSVPKKDPEAQLSMAQDKIKELEAKLASVVVDEEIDPKKIPF